MLLRFFVLVLAVLVAVSLTTVIQRRSCIQSGQKIVSGSYSATRSLVASLGRTISPGTVTANGCRMSALTVFANLLQLTPCFTTTH